MYVGPTALWRRDSAATPEYVVWVLIRKKKARVEMRGEVDVCKVGGDLTVESARSDFDIV
jgi:hypothetical protein